jgi:gas vesicle protein
MAQFHLGKTNSHNEYLTTFGLLLLGLGVGAVAGLLTAPKSGKQLRKEIGRKVEDARDKVEEVGGQVSKRAGELWESGQELAEAAKRKAEPIARIVRPA